MRTNKYSLKNYFKISRFDRGIINNALSFLIVGLCGLILNVLILYFYNLETLGIFNQAFAIYVIISQLANFGLYYSVLNVSSDVNINSQQKIDSIFSALILGILISIPVILVALNFIDNIIYYFNSRPLGKSIEIGCYALVFFSGNKVLIAGLNGLGRVSLVAFFNALRPSLIIIVLIIAVLSKVQGQYLFVVFFFSELFLFTFLLWYYLSKEKLPNPHKVLTHIITHITFGSKSVLNALLVEFNPKVDILLIGFYFNDEIAGAYSIAAMIIEGINQIPQIFMINLNQRLSTLYKKNKNDLLSKLITNTKNNIFFIMFICLFLSNFILYSCLSNFIDSYEIYNSIINFHLTLSIGILSFSGYYPLQMIFNQNSYPGYYSFFLSSCLLFNLTFSIILIKYYSYYGIAIGTALTNVIAIIILKYICKNQLNIKF